MEIADRRRAAVTNLDHTGLSDPLKRLAHRRPRDTEDLGQTSLTGEGVTGRELAVDNLGKYLVEDLVGHGLPLYGTKCHTRTVENTGHVVNWYDHKIAEESP